MTALASRTGRRRLRMGLATLIGRPQGFFSPYRYAATVGPTVYPELEVAFAAADSGMKDLLGEISGHMDQLAPLQGPAPLPRWEQQWFPRLDGAAAFALVLRERPQRIIEVGSGHSTRMLAHAALETGQAVEIVCIDPAPRGSLQGLGVTWVGRVLGEGDIALFRELEAGDIAFFDSSHLLWPGSDVDLILNRILPVLAPGVLIHIHDVSLPDPYPTSWDWRGYTEQLGLGGWIMGQGVEIVFSSHYALSRLDAAEHVARLPLLDGALETSFWLRRC